MLLSVLVRLIPRWDSIGRSHSHWSCSSVILVGATIELYIQNCFWRYVITPAFTNSSFPMYKFSTIPSFHFPWFFPSPLMITTSPICVLDVLSLWCKLYLSLKATTFSQRNCFLVASLRFFSCFCCLLQKQPPEVFCTKRCS